MALRSFNLAAQANGTLLTFSIAPNFFDPGSTMLFWKQSPGSNPLRPSIDYIENGDRQTFTIQGSVGAAPASTDDFFVYYEDQDITPLPADFDPGYMRGNYLFGLDLKDQYGRVMSESTLGNKISIVIARLEREFKDFSMTPQVIKSTSVLGVKDCNGNYVLPPDPEAIAEADIFEDPYDYDVNDYVNWGYLALRRKPIVSIERVRLIYPTGQTIINYPKEWIKIYHKFGQFCIVPMAGSFKQYPLIGQGAMYLPLLSGFLTKNVPQLINVDYTAGLISIPDDLKDAVYKGAAIEVLKIAGQAKAPGIAALSTSADGLSESTTLTQSGGNQLFGALIRQYEKDFEKFIADYKSNQTGMIDFRVM